MIVTNINACEHSNRHEPMWWVVTKYIILKAFKQNAFKLNNKKIERFSTFQQFLQQPSRQRQQQQ